MKTGEKIKLARKKAGLSQGELGEKLGISQAMVSAYENGVRNPKLETLQKIADALNVFMSDLLTFDILSNTGKSDIEDWVNSLEQESNRDKIDDLMCLLNEQGQQEAVRQIELLTEIPKYRKEDTPD